MVTRYLLDSDAIIDILKGRRSTIELIDNLHGQGDALCTCAMVIAEVFAGLSPIEQQRGQTLLGSMPFLIMTHSASRLAGTWRYEFARRGRQLSTADCLIAAVALDRKATLITGNLADYPMPDISVLPLPRS